MVCVENKMHADIIYKGLVEDILTNGEDRTDRTGVGTRAVFGRQCRYNLNDGFPILTTKKVHFKSVVGELLWFLRGDTNVKWLNDNGITIWNEWASKINEDDTDTTRYRLVDGVLKQIPGQHLKTRGDLGPIYGAQWRSWRQYDPNVLTTNKIDQIKQVIDQIKTNPASRRLIVSAWNVGELEHMALPPCHTMFQFHVSSSGKLSCQLYQRSGDIGLGIPFNVASYALLTHMIAQVCGLEVGEFIHTFGDLHCYNNHVDQLKLQIQRQPFPAPKLWLNPEITDIDSFTFDDIKLENYQHHPAIKMEVAV